MSNDYLATADVWAILDLIAIEFRTDPRSTQCFDRRLVDRVIEIARDFGPPPGVRLGATGRFPRGRINAHDQGELRLALAADHQHAIIRMEFGKPVARLGLPSNDARALAQMLTNLAAELDRRKT